MANIIMGEDNMKQIFRCSIAVLTITFSNQTIFNLLINTGAYEGKERTSRIIEK